MNVKSISRLLYMYFNSDLESRHKRTVQSLESAVLEKYHQSTAGKVFLCFSIYTNTKIIFDTRLSSDSVPVIHGLRFLGMVWIIMIHTIFYMSDYAGEFFQRYSFYSNNF